MQKLLPDPIYLLWLSDGDVWVEQWPIIEPKLSVLKELVKEQLDAFGAIFQKTQYSHFCHSEEVRPLPTPPRPMCH